MEVKIRPLQENDAYISVNWRNDSEVFKYTGNTYSQIITIEKELEWIKRVIKNENEYRCAIIVDGSSAYNKGWSRGYDSGYNDGLKDAKCNKAHEGDRSPSGRSILKWVTIGGR